MNRMLKGMIGKAGEGEAAPMDEQSAQGDDWQGSNPALLTDNTVTVDCS